MPVFLIKKAVKKVVGVAKDETEKQQQYSAERDHPDRDVTAETSAEQHYNHHHDDDDEGSERGREGIVSGITRLGVQGAFATGRAIQDYRNKGSDDKDTAKA